VVLKSWRRSRNSTLLTLNPQLESIRLSRTSRATGLGNLRNFIRFWDRHEAVVDRHFDFSLDFEPLVAHFVEFFELGTGNVRIDLHVEF
jgi:hypothetical protein